MDMAVKRTRSLGTFCMDADTPPLMSQARLSRPPVALVLSLKGLCNLNCLHCAGPERDPIEPSPELISWVAREVLPHVRSIRLGGGDNTEQLMSTRFERFMKATEPYRFDHFEMVTNLTKVSKSRARLIAEQMTCLEVSLEGVGNSYKQIRGVSWKRFARNMERIANARENTPGSKLSLTLLVCCVAGNLDEYLKIELFKSMGVDRVILREFRSELGAPSFAASRPSRKKIAFHKTQDLAHDPMRVQRFISDFRKICLQHQIQQHICFEGRYAPAAEPVNGSGVDAAVAVEDDGTKLTDCHLPFEMISISPRGWVSACCEIRFWNPGPLTSRSIEEVWNDPEFCRLRRRVNSPTPPRRCRKCEFKTRRLRVSDSQ
jgi:MoaA/NifB/PqqE/SkfB family radical SAM enzyme